MQILRDYMVTPVHGVSQGEKVKDAAQKMAKNKFGSLLVKDGDNQIGIITTTDITYRLVAKGLDPNTSPVSEIFSKPLIRMDFMLTLEEAFEKMLTNNMERLAITQSDQVVGILSIKDVMKALDD